MSYNHVIEPDDLTRFCGAALAVFQRWMSAV